MRYFLINNYVSNEPFCNGHASIKNDRYPLALSFYCGLFFLCVSLFATNKAYAVQTVLQDISVTSAGETTQIDIEFGLPLLYVKHFPQKSGEILQVQLKLSADNNDRRIHKEVRQAGDIKAQAGLESLLIYVTYEEGVPGGPYLTLRFSESVDFTVQAGSSLQSLTIQVTSDRVPIAEKPRFAKDKSADPDQEVEPDEKRQIPKKRQRRRPGDLDDRQVDEMMAKARQTLTFGDAKGAIELLRKIIRMPGSKHQQDARELLGLALERSNQIPRAKFEYKKYLRLYSKGEGSDRVRQRLTALQNLGIQKKKKLRRTRRGRKDDRFKLFGRWSQSVSSFFVQVDPDDPNASAPEDFVASRIGSSHLNLRGRYRGAKRNIQTVLAMNHTYDFRDRDETESRISSLNVDYDDFSQGLTVVFGRQRVRNGGVFGRFDGLITGYRISDSIKPHLFFGKPVSFFDGELYEQKFWGTKWDLGKPKSVFNGNAYFIHQRVDNIHDRKALGAVLRYSKKGATFFGLLDYDIEFKEVITTNVRLGWQFTPKAKANISFNDRTDLLTSKAVKTYNVANGSGGTDQVLFNIRKYLDNGLTEEDIAEIAKSAANRTQNSTVGITYQIDKDKQVNFDVSVFSSSGTGKFPFDEVTAGSTFTPEELNALNPSINDTSSPGTADQYLYSFQWISSNTFVERDLHVVGSRVAQNETYNEVSFYINSRLPPIRNWNPRPRILFSQRKFADDTKGSLTTIKPELKIDYRWKKAWVFDVDISVEFLDYSELINQDGLRESVRFSYHYTF